VRQADQRARAFGDARVQGSVLVEKSRPGRFRSGRRQRRSAERSVKKHYTRPKSSRHSESVPAPGHVNLIGHSANSSFECYPHGRQSYQHRRVKDFRSTISTLKDRPGVDQRRRQRNVGDTRRRIVTHHRPIVSLISILAERRGQRGRPRQSGGGPCRSLGRTNDRKHGSQRRTLRPRVVRDERAHHGEFSRVPERPIRCPSRWSRNTNCLVVSTACEFRESSPCAVADALPWQNAGIAGDHAIR